MGWLCCSVSRGCANRHLFVNLLTITTIKWQSCESVGFCWSSSAPFWPEIDSCKCYVCLPSSSLPPDSVHPCFLLFISLLLQTFIVPVLRPFAAHDSSPVQSCLYIWIPGGFLQKQTLNNWRINLKVKKMDRWVDTNWYTWRFKVQNRNTN